MDQYVEWSGGNFRDKEIERAFSQVTYPTTTDEAVRLCPYDSAFNSGKIAFLTQ